MAGNAALARQTRTRLQVLEQSRADPQNLVTSGGFRPRLCDNPARNDHAAMYPGFPREYFPERDLI